MDVLIVSKNDVCRSRIAQALLLSFGKGIKVSTAGVNPSNVIQESVVRQMETNGYEISVHPASLVDDMAKKKWAYVITLCPEAEEAVDLLEIVCEYRKSFDFPDIFQSSSLNIQERIDNLYEIMFRALFNLWRDDLRDNILPSCTCGANTFCRCE